MELVFCSCYQMKLVTQRCGNFLAWKVNQVQIQLFSSLRLNMKKSASRDREFPKAFAPQCDWGGEERRREVCARAIISFISRTIFSKVHWSYFPSSHALDKSFRKTLFFLHWMWISYRFQYQRTTNLLDRLVVRHAAEEIKVCQFK